MTALIEKIASSHISKKLAQFLVPHKHNNHHPYLIRHESLFIVTFIILFIQFFSFSDLTHARVLGYGTDITKATIINLTNQERSSRGLKTLKESALLDQSAKLKGQDMFAKDYWAHFAPDGTSPWYFFKKVGYNYNWAGENLARDFSTSAGVIAGWMASQGHRDNMLNPNFTEIGISVQNGTLQGDQTTLVVEHLGQTLTSSKSGTSNNSNTSDSSSNITPINGKPATLEENYQKEEKKQKQATSAANVSQINEKIASAFSPGFNITKFWDGLNLGQKTTVILLSILLSLFVFDSVILFRKNKARHNSQSLLHAGVISVLIIAIIRGAIGGVL